MTKHNKLKNFNSQKSHTNITKSRKKKVIHFPVYLATYSDYLFIKNNLAIIFCKTVLSIRNIMQISMCHMYGFQFCGDRI